MKNDIIDNDSYYDNERGGILPPAFEWGQQVQNLKFSSGLSLTLATIRG
jgi:hypothetical protein